jgi:hypothetical protein
LKGGNNTSHEALVPIAAGTLHAAASPVELASAMASLLVAAALLKMEPASCHGLASGALWNAGAMPEPGRSVRLPQATATEATSTASASERVLMSPTLSKAHAVVLMKMLPSRRAG